MDGWTCIRSTTDFEAFGRDWATFDVWQKQERKKLRKKKLWGYTTKIGSLLEIALTIIKLLEIFISNNHQQ